MTKQVQAFYSARNGASCMQVFRDETQLAVWMERQKRDVDLKLDGERVGGVVKLDGRWCWYFERGLFDNEKQETRT